MTVAGSEAWITSAVEEKCVRKALVLAASLRRVHTGKKLVVITTFAIPKDLREKLKSAFDLVVLIEQRSSNGLNLEDYAKVEALSLQVFTKCVYLSPNSMVVRNCDDMFEKYSSFAASFSEKAELKSNVFLFTPNLELSRALRKIKCDADDGNNMLNGDIEKGFSSSFNLWLQNNLPNVEQLDEEYNIALSFKSDDDSKSLSLASSSIVSFCDEHPLDLVSADGSAGKIQPSDTIEKFVSELCQRVDVGDPEAKLNTYTDVSFRFDVFKKEPIAIVGMSFRLPGGNNAEDFWKLLINGKDGIQPLPPSRWRRDQTIQSCQNRNVEAGFLSVPVDEFDNDFFGMSKEEVELMDPQNRLLHEVTWEAFEDAMIDPLSLRGTPAGVFVGTWLTDYRDMVGKGKGIEESQLGRSIATGANGLSHFLGTTGPSIGGESGCSSAIVAVDMACKSLQSRECNLALACGANILLHPFDYDTLSFVLAPDGRCKTFDAEADGFGRAEGCAVLLLKRLSDAVREDDNIWGLIRGSAITQEGLSRSLGTPTVHCESMAMELALKDAQVDPLDVTYIESHGTGTPVGDPMEIAAIQKAYSKGRSEPLVIGSVKTNVGHTESVSGITGIIKVLLSLKYETIPKHLHLKQLNPAINLEAIPAVIPLEPTAWPKRQNKPRIAGVSSFGISGTDGHVIIQEAPQTPNHKKFNDEKDERPLHIMTLSAKCPKSFQDLLKTYENILGSKEDEEGFPDFAYSANTGRASLSHRAVIIAKDFREARESISNKSYKFSLVQSSHDQLCFVFPGNGSQYSGIMAESLFNTSPVFRAELNKCHQLLSKGHGINLKQLLWGKSTNEGEESSHHIHSQTINFSLQYSLSILWRSWGVKPNFVVGYGAGEYAAAVAVGLLDLADALKLAVEKDRLIDAQNQNHNDPFPLATFKKLVQNMKQTGRVALKDAPQYISGMDGKIVDFRSIDGGYWIRQLKQTLDFKAASKVIGIAKSRGCSLFLEIGSRSVTPNYEDQSMTWLPSICDRENEWPTLLDSLAQLHLSGWKGQVNWKGFDRCYKRSHVPLPFYPFNRKKIWNELETVSPMKHPLLGKPLLTPSTSTMFESRLTLKNVPFAQDHVIGNTVVFPGAGFLEMCLAGGHAATEGKSGSERLSKPQHPVALKSLKISSPLGLYDSGYCRLQTIAKLEKKHDDEEDETSYSLGVHRYIQSTPGMMGEWIPHATAKFLPSPSPSVEKIHSTPMDIQAMQTSWERTDNAEFYEKLPEVGLRFGPKFQSLETGWKSEEAMLVSVKLPEDNDNGYLIHPILADAMIQATMLWTSKDKLKMKLQVPVHIGEFIWLQPSTSSTSRYIHCATNKEGRTNCILLDGEGVQLAQMRDVDLIETSVKLVEGMLQRDGKTAMPKLWGDVWKSTTGALYGAYDLSQGQDICFADMIGEKSQALAELNDIGEYEENFHDNLCNLARLFFLNAMYGAGWKPQKGLPFTSDQLINLFPNLKEHFKRYIRFFLQALTEIGMLSEASENSGEYRFQGLPPTQLEINEGLSRVVSPDDGSRMEYKLVVETGSNLSKVMLNKVEALSLLFPDDPQKTNAGQYYSAMMKWIAPVGTMVIAEILNPIIMKAREVYSENCKTTGLTSPVFRVLEVGSGTGSSTKLFLEMFEAEDLQHYEYCYTDVSNAFFNAAEKEFEKYSKHIIFKKFDMNEDPLAQGFCPKYFDMIIAGDVLHVAKDIRKTLRFLRRLLKPGGLFEIIETIVPCQKVTQVFGILEGYWQFDDLDFRPLHTTLTGEKWEEALREIGCQEVNCTPGYNNVHGIVSARLTADGEGNEAQQSAPQYSWLIFCTEATETLAAHLDEKLVGVDRKARIVKRPVQCSETEMDEMIKSEFVLAGDGVRRLEGIVYLWGLLDDEDPCNRDQTRISLPVINLVREMQNYKDPPRLYLVTQGAAHVEGYEVSSPAAGTIHGIVKSLSNEIASLQLSCLDLSPDMALESQVEEIFYDLWWPEKSNRIICFRNNARLLPKLTQVKVNYNEPLALPSGCDRFQLLLPKTRLIGDLEFGVMESCSLEDDGQVEVQVKAMALNFRDVFAVLKPIAQFEDLNTVGLDFAGVVTKLGSGVSSWKVGDRVIGMNMDKNLSLPSHVKMDEQLLVPLPTSFTFAEGVTLPAVFSTAVYCLIKVAKMKRGDTVLIHTGSGGVGLCAIQLAKHVGAEIISTAGSKRKQTYLRNLGIQHVFHSRTTQFGEQILKVTNGRGVDIVLNSITGEGFKEASLKALATNGRFIEMSKLNVWEAKEVEELRPDVFYQVVDLTTLEKAEMLGLIDELKKFLNADHVRPIAYERFDALNIKGALNYLQKAKHIGKIVCVMPEMKVENAKITAATPLFNQHSTYLVTGGLGGIGFEVVKWMLSSGAKHVAIASRSPPKPEIASQLESWNKDGKHVEAFSVDIGDYDQCRKLFQQLESEERGFPQLRGVMHAAGVLADAILENQTWDKFRHTYNPKVSGSWNLHDLTKELLLEHFVLFSSIAASVGSPGQTNHAASNSFEDSLAAYRRSIGLPGTTVNWGNWGEVGVATELDFPGVRPLSTSQGIVALETFLKTQTSHLSVINLESPGLASKLFPCLKAYLDDKRLFGDLKPSILINSDEFWKDMDRAEDREGKLLIFKTSIKSTLRNILKMDPDDVIDDLTEFQALGIDSLMMLELKNGLQNILGARMALTASQLKDCNNTEILANRLVDILLGEDENSEVQCPSMDELSELVREDSLLPEHILPTAGMELKDIAEVENVLLLGATGVLGPYLLRELSQRPNIKKIYCLLRKSLQLSPSERLLKRLDTVCLTQQIDMSKVECIQGDLTNDKFGLSEEEYTSLAENVDAIINSAVRADHTAKYWKSPDSRKLDLRNVNVKGTVRLLEFASVGTLKHVYHASTLLTVLTTDDEQGCLLEDWQDVGAFDEMPTNAGYILSKHISEQLCKQALDRGIPCKAFRLPGIGGDSQTGRCDYLTNHVILRWLAYLKLKCMPDLPAPLLIIPVDHCAKLSLDVFFHPGAPPDVYNISHRDAGMDQSIIGVAEELLGVTIQPVSYSEFVGKLQLEGDDSPLAPFKKRYSDEEATVTQNLEVSHVASCLQKYTEDSTNFFESRKLPRFINYYGDLESTEDVMRRDVRFLKESGVFEKFGIKL